MVSLDLALLYSHQGRSSEVIQLVTETVPWFDSSEAHREAVASLSLLRKAVDEEILRRLRTFVD